MLKCKVQTTNGSTVIQPLNITSLARCVTRFYLFVVIEWSRVKGLIFRIHNFVRIVTNKNCLIFSLYSTAPSSFYVFTLTAIAIECNSIYPIIFEIRTPMLGMNGNWQIDWHVAVFAVAARWHGVNSAKRWFSTWYGRASDRVSENEHKSCDVSRFNVDCGFIGMWRRRMHVVILHKNKIPQLTVPAVERHWQWPYTRT